MKKVRKFLRPLFITERGKPRFLSKLFILSSSERFLHNWISKNMDKNDVILDVGARLFPYTRYQDVKAIYGIDIPSKSEGYLGWNKKNLKSLRTQKNLHPVVASATSIPFPDKKFDKVVMTEVIEHIKNDEKVIGEVARVLKKNGKLLLTTPNGDEVKNTNPHHFRHYKQNELKSLLSKYFKKVDLKLKFPNQELFIKQHQKNTGLLEKFIWRAVYDIWILIHSGRFSTEGYTIITECKSPKTG